MKASPWFKSFWIKTTLTLVSDHTWPNSPQKGLQLPFDSAHHRRPLVAEGCVQLHQGGPRPDFLQSILPAADTTDANDGDSAYREAQVRVVRQGPQSCLVSALRCPC